MPKFRYLATDRQNASRSGVLETETRLDALAMLQRRDLLVLQVTPESRWGGLWAALNADLQTSGKLSPKSLAAMTFELGSLLQAGIKVEEALALVSKGLTRARERKTLETVRDQVRGGMALHAALALQPATFPPSYQALVQAGETSGSLGLAMTELAADLTLRREVADNIRNAMLYPGFLLLAAIASAAVLLTYVVPSIEELFGPEKVDGLPTATRLLIGASHLARDHGLQVLLGIVIGAAFLGFGASRPAGRRWLDRALCRGQGVGALIRSIETGRFLQALSALVGGGIPLARATPIASGTIANTFFRARTEAAYERLVNGATLGDALESSGVFPADAVSLIRVGERTGQLAPSLSRAAKLHRERAQQTLKTVSALAGPVMTIAIGLFAGTVMYAMLTAILGINDLAAS